MAVTSYKLGDTVQVKPGLEHDSMVEGKTGTIMLVSTPALGIKFEGIPGIHKWYVDTEIKKVEATKNNKV